MNKAHVSIRSAARHLFSWLLVILLLITALPVVAQGPERTGEPPGRTTEQGAEPTSTPVPALQEAPKRLKGLEEPLPPRTGFVPPPMDLSHLKGQRLLGQYVSAPASWDWRTTGKVTSVKDQGACGSYYAFASIGNIESKLLIDSAGTWDFSENNAKECNWYETSGTGGGTSCDGGNYWQLASLFSKKGTVLESCDPYVASDVSCNATCPYQKTLLDWRVISGDAVPDTEVLKTYIQTYGPVYTSMYAGDNDAWDTEFGNYDGSYTLCYAGTDNPNHAVLIVGWDDSLTHAGGTGGWIVKNSWGTDWGGTCGYGTERGYFTIAYGSASIGKDSSFVYDWQDYDTSGGVMYYDEGGWSTSWGCTGSTTAWGLVRFTPTSNTSVTRVEFWTADATTDVDVYIYDDFNGTAPSSLLAQKLNNSFDEAGYHSVALDTPLPVTSGDDVVAVVKFTNDSYIYPVVADELGPSETGRTYISCDGSAPWDDMGDSESDDVAIRLRTSAGGGGVGPVVYDSHTVDDDNSDESSGNDDGIVDPGETIELYVDLYNQGSDTVASVQACISEDSPYVAGFLFNTCSNYGDIPGGGTDTNSDDFDFEVDPSTPDGHVICFDLDITSSNGGPWSDSFCVTVGGGAKTYLPIVLKNSIPGLLYFDDFSDPNSGWPIWDGSNCAFDYNDGNYRIQLKQNYWSAWAWPGFACADCTIEVEAWRCSGANSGYGIVFGLNSSGDQFYSFEVQPGNREYRLRRYDEGTWVTLISFTYSSYISSYNSHNRLKATREGSQIKLYVNGYYLTSYTDSTYTGSRYVGVHGRSGATSPVWLRYDDFTVWGSGYGTTSATEGGSGGVGMAPAPPD